MLKNIVKSMVVPYGIFETKEIIQTNKKTIKYIKNFNNFFPLQLFHVSIINDIDKHGIADITIIL